MFPLRRAGGQVDRQAGCVSERAAEGKSEQEREGERERGTANGKHAIRVWENVCLCVVVVAVVVAAT